MHTKNHNTAAITAITLLAAVLRICAAGRASLWYDEGATLLMSQGGPDHWIVDTHPPLYYALVHYWMHFGNSEFWLRLLSAIPAVATVPIVYSLGKKLFGPGTGLLSALFLTLMPFHIDYSQQARMYSFFVFFFACALWALQCSAGEGRHWHWATYAVSAVLLAYIQGIGILYVGVLVCLYPLISHRPFSRQSLLPFAATNLIVAISYLPWLMLLRESNYRTGFMLWVPPVGWYTTTQILATFIGKYIPVDAFIPSSWIFRPVKWVVMVLHFAPVLTLLGLMMRELFRARNRRSVAIAWLAFVLPVFMILFISVAFMPLYIDRVLLPAAVGFVLLLGASASAENLSNGKFPLILATVVVFSLNTFFLLSSPQKENYRGLSLRLQSSFQAEDWVLFIADSGIPRLLVEYYDPMRKIPAGRVINLRDSIYRCRGNPDPCMDQFEERFRNARRVWIIGVHDAGLRDRAAIQRWLDRRLIRLDETEFDGRLIFAEWRPVGS